MNRVRSLIVGVVLAMLTLCSGGVVGQTTSLTFLTNGLVANYLLFGNGRDQSGSGFDLTIRNGIPAEGRFGLPHTSYHFIPDNLSSLVSSNMFWLSPDSGMTISAWFQYNARPGGENAWEPLLAFEYEDPALGLVRSFSMGVEKAPVVFYLDFSAGGIGSGMFQSYDGSSFSFADGQWHQIVFSIGNRKLLTQLDGTTIHWQLLPGATFDFRDIKGLLQIGVSANGRFNGSIADVRIYQRALSEAELTSLHEYERVGGIDADNDGLSDYLETWVHRTDPLNFDTDNDKVSDGDEVAEGTNPLDSKSGPPPRLLAPLQIAGQVAALVTQDVTTKYPVTSFDFRDLPSDLTGDTNTGRIHGVPAVAGTKQASVLLGNQWGTRTNLVAFNIARGTPIITWNPPASIPYGTVLDATFYNPVSSVPGTFSYDPGIGTKPDIGSPVNAKLAFMPDDSLNYDAVTVTQRVAVVKADQTIAFEPTATVVLGDAPVILNGSSSSGLPLQYQVVSGPGSISGTSLSILGGGTITLRAAQPGDVHYHAAAAVVRTIEVKLRLTVASVLGGTVLREPESATLGYQQQVVLTAIPDDGYLFGGWAGDVVSQQNPLSITLTTNVRITPLFTPRWMLAITNTVGGSVITEPVPAAVTNGSKVVAIAVADNGYGFRGWKGTIASTSNPLEFVLNTNISLTAEFGRVVKLSLAQTEGGTVSLSPVQSQYLAGDMVTLVATANEGFRFQGWKAPFQGLTNGTSLTLANDFTVEGVFKKLQQVVVSSTGEGTVTVQGGPYHDVGESITLTAEPKTGWAFSGWSGSVTTNSNPLTIVVSTNTTVSATFKRLFKVVASASGGGSVDVTPLATSYLDGSIVTLWAKPDPHWRLESWTGGVTGTNNQVAVTVTNDLTVVALFLPSYRLLVSEKQDLSAGFHLLAEGEVGVSYVIETSSGLLSWSLLTTMTNTGNPMEYLDKQARSISRRFYRLRPENP